VRQRHIEIWRRFFQVEHSLRVSLPAGYEVVAEATFTCCHVNALLRAGKQVDRLKLRVYVEEGDKTAQRDREHKQQVAAFRKAV
jgi:hypothetical protein